MMPKVPPNGFAMVETLIATAIIAAMLGVTFQSIALAARQTQMIEDRRHAILVAQSQLSAVGAAQADALHDSKGSTNGISWTVTVRPYRVDRASVARLEEVTVSAGLAGEQRPLIVLKTVRVAQ